MSVLVCSLAGLRKSCSICFHKIRCGKVAHGPWKNNREILMVIQFTLVTILQDYGYTAMSLILDRG